MRIEVTYQDGTVRSFIGQHEVLDGCLYIYRPVEGATAIPLSSILEFNVRHQ